MKPHSYLLTILFIAGIAITLQSCGPAYVSVVPATPYYAQPVSPYAGAIWIDGGWNYRGGRHVYSQGYWGRPRAGRSYQAGAWQQSPRGYHWRGGRWR